MTSSKWKKIFSWGLYLGTCYIAMAAAFLWYFRWQHTGDPLDLKLIREITVFDHLGAVSVPDGLRDRLIDSATYESGSPPWKVVLLGEATSSTGETYRLRFGIVSNALGVSDQPGFYRIRAPVSDEWRRFLLTCCGDEHQVDDPEEAGNKEGINGQE